MISPSGDYYEGRPTGKERSKRSDTSYTTANVLKTRYSMAREYQQLKDKPK